MTAEVLFRVPRRTAAGLFLALFLGTACGGDGPAGPGDLAPTITVTGVEANAAYTGPVTITIAVDRGTYSALLDGASFFSGQSVAAQGTHQLVVNARNGSATSTKQLSFTIGSGSAGVVIVRLINLGANSSGGGGDAILITDSSAAGMVHGLVDAGPAGANASNPGYVAQRLAQLAVDTLSFLMLTHAHGDHFEGMPAVVSAFPIKQFLYNGQARNYNAYNTLVQQARGKASSTPPLSGNTVYTLALGRGSDKLQLNVIPPLSKYLSATYGDSSSAVNEGSLGMELKQGTFRMFFTGDGEVEANARWKTTFSGNSGDVNVLKAGHHGANDAIFDNGFNVGTSWLTHTSPEAVVISANGTSHPRSNALNAILSQTSQRTYCTNVHGEITIRITRAGAYTITPQYAAGSVCVKGSDATS